MASDALLASAFAGAGAASVRALPAERTGARTAGRGAVRVTSRTLLVGGGLATAATAGVSIAAGGGGVATWGARGGALAVFSRAAAFRGSRGGDGAGGRVTGREMKVCTGSPVGTSDGAVGLCDELLTTSTIPSRAATISAPSTAITAPCPRSSGSDGRGTG